MADRSPASEAEEEAGGWEERGQEAERSQADQEAQVYPPPAATSSPPRLSPRTRRGMKRVEERLSSRRHRFRLLGESPGEKGT